MKPGPLWIPKTAFEHIKKRKPKINDGVTARKKISLKTVHNRQISSTANGGGGGMSAVIVVVIALSTFFGALALSALVAGIVITKIKADAERQLENSLAKLLLSANTRNT